MNDNVVKNKESDVIADKSNFLLDRISSTEDRKQLENALKFSVKMHHGQVRKSGLPFVSHCIDVANKLLDWKMDQTTIISALLHDVVEDTDVTLKDIEKEFGSEVAMLVDGVTKVENIAFRSIEHKQAENFTKLFLSLANDLRVIIIKFADRLNNMETIQFLSSKKRKEIALETKEIFVPLAHRLGMAKVKWELEDLSLKCLDLRSYNSIKKKIETSTKLNEDILSNAIAPIKSELDSYKIQSNIFGRYKSISSIHRKINNRAKKFEEIKKKNNKIKLHLTGPLQSNKVKQALSLFDVFHTLDREKLLKELIKFPEIIKEKSFFIQVNTGKEITKNGVFPEDTKNFLNLCKTHGLNKVEGLMCIPPINQSPTKHFQTIIDLTKECGLGRPSIGMSSDYEHALEFDPKYIRLGTVLFGKR